MGLECSATPLSWCGHRFRVFSLPGWYINWFDWHFGWQASTTSTASNFYLDSWGFVSSFGCLYFGQAKVVLIERHVSSVEHSIAAFLHQLVPSVSLVVPKKTHLLRTVVKLLPLSRRDQGVGNTVKHSQITEIRFSAVPNFMEALTLQGGVW